MKIIKTHWGLVYNVTCIHPDTSNGYGQIVVDQSQEDIYRDDNSNEQTNAIREFVEKEFGSYWHEFEIEGKVVIDDQVHLVTDKWSKYERV